MGIHFVNEDADFTLSNPEKNEGLYFPLANESGVMGDVSPDLCGDLKTGQNSFLLEPVSIRNLYNNKSSENFWCLIDGRIPWSLTGRSAAQQAELFSDAKEETFLEAGFMFHKVTRKSEKYGIRASVSCCVPASAKNSLHALNPRVELIQAELTNTGSENLKVRMVSAVPLYARSADNIRDHRDVTAMLNRLYTTEYGITVFPTFNFDERGHRLNDSTYGIFGKCGDGEAPEGFIPSEADFVGEGGSLEMPGMLYAGLRLKPAGTQINGGDVLGGLAFHEKVLKPGESTVYIFALAFGSAAEGHGGKSRETEAGNCSVQAASVRLEASVLDWLAPETFENARLRTGRYWQDKVNIRFKTADGNFDKWMRWVGFEPFLRRIYGCSFLPHHDYGRGGRGWRDLWQDCLALILMDAGSEKSSASADSSRMALLPKSGGSFAGSKERGGRSPDSGQNVSVREMLINNFAGVRADGTNATIIGQAPGEFLADRNHIVRIWMDHGMWPLLTTEFYINQTGDLGLLFEEEPYFNDAAENIANTIRTGESAAEKPAGGTAAEGPAAEGTAADDTAAGEEPAESADETAVRENCSSCRLCDASGKVYRGTTLEHLLIENLAAFFDVGENGKIRLHNADWNDALDMAPDKGESVAFTMMYAENLRKLSALLKRLGEQGHTSVLLLEELKDLLFLEHPEAVITVPKRKQEILKAYAGKTRRCVSGRKAEIPIPELCRYLKFLSSSLKKRIHKEEWLEYGNLGWYNGYYDNHGRKLEGIRPDGQARMMLTGQVFAVMSGTADDKQVKKITEAAERFLFDERAGGYRLNTEFREVKTDMGRMFGFAYGEKENGSVFSHMDVMYANALYGRGFYKEGFKALAALYRYCADFEKSRIYPGVPEYISSRGRGVYHYLTGAASWFLITAVTEMFGVRGSFGDLLLAPALMPEQFDADGKAEVSLRFAGRPLRIVYFNEGRLSPEDYRISRAELQGRVIAENERRLLIPRTEIVNAGKGSGDAEEASQASGDVLVLKVFLGSGRI